MRRRVQYSSHKAFNEFQAKDYIDKHGMTITAVRPANVAVRTRCAVRSIT